MSANLLQQSYGKSAIRLTKVRRLESCHELVEMKVNITLTGEFHRSYTHGDNTKVIATDSMKNTVYLLAKDHPLDSPESFALHLARHFVKSYSQVAGVGVNIDQSLWRRISVAGVPYPTAFESGGAELRQAAVNLHRDNDADIHGKLSELLVLKTTDSAFTHFVRDKYTSLADATDRILATKMSADWTFNSEYANFNAAFTNIRTVMLEKFALHKSDAVQQTLFEMADAALAAEPSIKTISLKMPNKHRIPFNFKPFGLEFNHDIYVTTDEPSGEISATLTRERA